MKILFWSFEKRLCLKVGGTKIKNDYNGLIICPYLGDEIWGKNANKKFCNNSVYEITKYLNNIVGNDWKDYIKYLAEWYRHWETGSGVIWSKSGIKDIILIKTYDENNK